MGNKRTLALVVWGGLIAVLAAWIVLPAPEQPAGQQAADKAAGAACRADLQCWAKQNHFAASAACLTAVDRAAGGAGVWDDGADLKVGYHRWLDRDAATLTYYGQALSVPNARGQLVRQRYECDFDPAKGEMTAFRMDAVVR